MLFLSFLKIYFKFIVFFLRDFAHIVKGVDLYLFILNFGFIYLFIYLWLCWVFVSVRGLSLVAASGGHSSLRCAGLIIAASLVAEHRFQTRRLSNCGSRA